MSFKIKPFLCKYCGDTNPENFYVSTEKNGRKHYLKSFCRKCHSRYTWNKKREYKIIVVTEHGGKCKKCGYDKCIGALEFHHPDKSKDIELFHKKRNRGLEFYREQVKDCILLCANCHREIHYFEKMSDNPNG